MECKFNNWTWFHGRSKVEVAPYWNVNVKGTDYYTQEEKVEVAPYWNVNIPDKLKDALVQLVEVAPYWNVNGRVRDIIADILR